MSDPAPPTGTVPVTAESPLRSRLTQLRQLGGLPRYAVILACDALAVATSLLLAFMVRFEGSIPPERVSQLLRCLPLLLAIRLPLQLGFGLHRWSFRLSGLHEGLRIVYATLLGSALFSSSFYFLQRAAEDVSLGPPRSVIVLEFLLSTSLIGAVRFSFRVFLK